MEEKKGYLILWNPRLTKGTAFSREEKKNMDWKE
jgi:hypothetical protein